MAGASFKVDVDLSSLEKLVNNLQGFSAQYLLDNIGELVTEQTKHRIAVEKKTPEGRAWSKRKDNKPHPLLENTHRLFSSINHQVKGNTVDIGTNIIYAATQQYGDSNRNIPARSYLGINDENKAQIASLISGYIEDLKDGK